MPVHPRNLFSDPTIESQLALATYVAVGTLAVLLWDILQHARTDFRIYFFTKFGISKAVYALSRLGCLAYVLLKVIFLTLMNKDCGRLENAAVATYVLGHGMTCLLFYFRVCAVYSERRWVLVFFGVAWVGVLGGSLAAIDAIAGAPITINDDTFCMAVSLSPHISVAVFTTFINDTLIFLAITYKLATTSTEGPSMGQQVRTVMCGTSLSAFSKALLHESQIYYLITVLMNAAMVITFYVLSGTPRSPFRTFLIPPATAIENIMACWVFRNAKTGRYSIQCAAAARQQLTTDIFIGECGTQGLSERRRDHVAEKDEEDRFGVSSNRPLPRSASPIQLVQTTSRTSQTS